MSDYENGLAVRRAVLGDAHVDRALEGASEFTAPFQEFITRYAWGGVWTRDGLDRRTRSCVTLAVLTALGHTNELGMHVKAADGTPMANPMLTMLHLLGRDDVEKFGDSTGELDLNNAAPAPTTEAPAKG